MSQMTWTYVDDYGKNHQVGLVHGNSTGHIMIYCNSKVMFIDFHVWKNKKYSFFINDELFDIHVEEKEGKFSYGFEIDEKSQTPKNTFRKENEKKMNLSIALFSFTVLAIIATGIFIACQFIVL